MVKMSAVTLSCEKFYHLVSEPWTQYQVKVAARTSAGYGNYSDSTTIRTLEDKPAVSNDNNC